MFTYRINESFLKCFNFLKDSFECNYLFYQLQLHSYKITLSTHLDWMDVYVNNLLIKNCPIVRIGVNKLARKTNNFCIVRWNDVHAISASEKNTVGIRTEFNICNGLSLGRKSDDVYEYFGLATDTKNYGFSRELLSGMNLIKSIMNQLRYHAVIDVIQNFNLVNKAVSLNSMHFLSNLFQPSEGGILISNTPDKLPIL